MSEVEGFWLEIAGPGEDELPAAAAALLPLVGALLDAERQRAFLGEELTSRYEEIDLLYAISEILGQTVRLEEATQTIVREVSTVVGARRASIMVFDEATGVLRTVAARGFGADGLAPVPVDDECSIAAARSIASGGSSRTTRRSRTLVATDCGERARLSRAGVPERADLLRRAGLAAPLRRRHQPDRPARRRPLHPRATGSWSPRSPTRSAPRSRTPGWSSATCASSGSATSSSWRTTSSSSCSRRPRVLQGDAEVAARCLPADSVGGDFYTFTRLGRGRVGVMLGDVASHGFSAALVMALVMSAAGIHAAASLTPDETLSALLESLVDRARRRPRCTSACSTACSIRSPAGSPTPTPDIRTRSGCPRFGEPERLEATAPPLGLATAGSIERRQVPWAIEHDLLVLWTDGLVDARNADGEPFGEAAAAGRGLPAPHRAARGDRGGGAGGGGGVRLACRIDDRTLLVLRI